MKFYTNKTTSISVIDTKFHENPLFCLRDFQFFQTAVTNLSYRYCQPFVQVSGDFTFQQDSASAHHARETVALLSAETPDFNSPLDWQLNSPDLNPVDYAIWGILQKRVYHSQIHGVDHVKERVIEEWCRFDQNIIDRAVNQCRDRLHKCVRANMRHFERLI